MHETLGLPEEVEEVVGTAEDSQGRIRAEGSD